MKVLLPDFIYYREEQEQKAPRTHRNNFLLPRKTSIDLKFTPKTAYNWQHQARPTKKMPSEAFSSSVSISTTLNPKTNLTRPSLHSIEINPSLTDGDDIPIHSHRTHRQQSTLLVRKQSHDKRKVINRKKIIQETFNFLTTKKYPKAQPAIQLSEKEIAEGIKKITRQSTSRSKFPTKKVKSSFFVEEYRPWSPKNFFQEMN